MRDVKKSPGASAPRALGPAFMSPASLVTIRMQEIYRALSANYTRLLNEIVFSRDTILEENRKLKKSLEAVIKDDEANLVLTILWRESPYVSEDELSYNGFQKRLWIIHLLLTILLSTLLIIRMKWQRQTAV